MKKITVILIILLLLSSFIITGCKEDSGMSIEDRIEAFISDLNSANRSGIFKEHFHPDSYSYSGGPSAIEDAFEEAGQNYTATSISGSGSSRTVEIGGDADPLSADYGNYRFDMREEEDDDWYIYAVYDNSAGDMVLPGDAS